MSAEQLWAERTYELGLYPISASTWLRDMMRDRYGRDGSWFRFGVDHGTYRPREVERRRDTVMFYGRHVTPRRAVPLAMLALDELHRRRPDTRIVLYGDTEPPATSFPYEFLGVVNPEVLAWRYSEATVGLCLSLTNYSLIPQEMMACGLPCVDLAGRSPEAVFGRDGPVELAEPDPLAIADAVERLLADPRRWSERSAAGLAFVEGATWERAAAQVEKGLRRALAEREADGSGVEAPDHEHLREQPVADREHHDRRSDRPAEAPARAERRQREQRGVEREQREQIARLLERRAGVLQVAAPGQADRDEQTEGHRRVGQELRPAANELPAPLHERPARQRRERQRDPEREAVGPRGEGRVDPAEERR